MDNLDKAMSGFFGLDRSTLVMLATAISSGFIGAMHRTVKANKEFTWGRIWVYMTSPWFFFGLGSAVIAGLACGESIAYVGGTEHQMQIGIAVGAWFGDKVFSIIETTFYTGLHIDRRDKD